MVAVLAAGAALAALFIPHGNFGSAVFVDIQRGTSTRGIAIKLAEAGVIGSRWQFLLARAVRPRARLQAGEYHFTEPASVWSVFDRLVKGDVYYYDLAVPEGANMFDIAMRLSAESSIDEADFLAAAADPSLIADLAPRAPSLEGYLFPSTYRLTRHTTAAQFCRQMTDRFRQSWRELRASGDAHDAVTLASLVEKETAVAGERALVSSVFHNRLKAGMTLDCDPTTIYAALLEKRYRGTIHRSDLNSRNLYNTYKHAGLPPGPIANPGTASLKAAIAPAETDYLFFVARPNGNGAHEFSRTLAEHDRAVAKYRRGQQKAGPGGAASTKAGRSSR